ncbi:MAG: HIT family protein [Dysgonamonadaceae bacterium]|nr:HIT family protein [Dysgonamonadaceae bacterium]MDD4728655.1 HIT family protein [Dysgonamonadaceae bacterium]
MSTIFTKIVKGEIPSYKIHENEQFYAFLDINPLKKGHTLVIPKKEVDYLFDIDDATLSDMIVYAKNIAVAIQQAISCKRVGLMVIGLEVPHAHIHLIPIQKEGDMVLSNARVKLSTEDFEEIARDIRSFL